MFKIIAHTTIFPVATLPSAISEPEYKKVFKMANKLLAQIKVELIYEPPKYMPWPEDPPLYTDIQLCRHLLALAPKINPDLALYILPPLNIPMQAAGAAPMLCCPKDGRRCCVAMPSVSKHDLKKSAVTMAHEVGHVFGADHDESEFNIMCSWAHNISHYVMSNMKFKRKAKREVIKCLKTL